MQDVGISYPSSCARSCIALLYGFCKSLSIFRIHGFEHYEEMEMIIAYTVPSNRGEVSDTLQSLSLRSIDIYKD